MLLALALFSAKRLARTFTPWISAAALFLVVPVISNAQEPQPPCVLMVPVYGPFGDRLPFRITRVSPEENRNLNLLSAERNGFKLTGNGDTILFPTTEIVGRAIEVTLEGPKGAVVTSKMVVTSCRLRRSLFFGQSDKGLDVSGLTITGRLSGCRFAGDWWVRAAPMFGGHERVHVVDGYVQSDGAFYLILGAYGVRHLLIIGKNKQPIKVVGIDMTIGKVTNVGAINLGGQCPRD